MRGVWLRVRDGERVSFSGLAVTTLRKWGRNKIHAMPEPAEGSEDFREIKDESALEIFYSEGEEPNNADPEGAPEEEGVEPFGTNRG